MKLNKNRSFGDQFICNFTKDIDDIVGLNRYGLYHHYILIEKSDLDNNKSVICGKHLAIRTPGGTVGYIKISDRKTIQEVHFYCPPYTTSYNNAINDISKRYIGESIEL